MKAFSQQSLDLGVKVLEGALAISIKRPDYGPTRNDRERSDALEKAEVVQRSKATEVKSYRARAAARKSDPDVASVTVRREHGPFRSGTGRTSWRCTADCG